MRKLLKLIHKFSHSVLGFCNSTCPTCGDSCVNTVVHQDGQHSCGDHFW